MRIRRVHAHAFGPFQEACLELGEGMTVVVGPNESGKSSWHAAVYAALCGVRRGPGQRSADREFARRHRPWEGERWEVSCTVDLPDGRTVELRHDLSGRVDCTARDVVLGRDVSSEVIHEGTPDGSRWLGLERRAFLALACVRQAEILAVTKHADALEEHLQRAAATAGTDETAAAALAAIEAFHRENVGLERRNSTRPLMAAFRRVEAAEERHESARRTHEDWLAREEVVAALETRARRARCRARAAEAALARAVADGLERRAARARELAARHPAPPPEVGADDRLARRVATALHGWERRPAVLPLSGPTAAELEARLAALPTMPEGDLEPHPDVVRAREALSRAASEVQVHRRLAPEVRAAVPAGGAPDSELLDLARELELPVPAVDAGLEARVAELRRGVGSRGGLPAPAWAGAALALAAAIAGVTLVAVGRVPAAAGALAVALAAGAATAGLLLRRGSAADAGADLGAAEAELLVARRLVAEAAERRTRAEGRLRSLGLPGDPQALRDLADALRRERDAREARDRWEAGEQRLRAVVDEARDRLAAALAGRGVVLQAAAAGEAVLAAASAYEEACRRRREISAAAGQGSVLGQALEARRRAEERLADDEERVRAALAELRAAAAGAGVAEGDVAFAPDELARRLGKWQEERERRRARLEGAEREWGELQALLGGRSLADVEADAQRARGRAQELAARTAAGTEAPDGAEDPEAVRRLVEEAGRLEREATGARSELEAMAAGLGSVSEAEEALEAAREELARVRGLSLVLETTRTFLERAQERVHRDIAPALASQVQARLARVTGGRYREVTVDPSSLRVEVRDGGGHWRDAALLSHGTAEQVFLLLRVAMSEILAARDARCPLLLDDVTVQSDPVRTRAILDVLHEVSADHQVVLFSQEDDVLRWARERLVGRDRLVRLAPPA